MTYRFYVSDMTSPQDFDYTDKLSFLAEWFDPPSGRIKKFILNYFPCDRTLELYDKDLNRIYLRRATCEKLDYKDAFVGNTIRVYGRQIKIVDYADCRTKKIVGKSSEHTLAILKRHAIAKLGEVISIIEKNGFRITSLRMCNLSRKQALDFYESRKGDAFLPFIVEYLVSGSIIAVELVGENAVQKWLELLGPGDPEEARETSPNSLRAIYGVKRDSNAFHGASTPEDAVREKEFFFPQSPDHKPPSSTAILKNTTCCIIKPHAIEEGKMGYIISAIMENDFKITAMQMFYLTNSNADEFLEVYKGVVSDYQALLSSFIDGPCVVLEIAGKNNDMDVHGEFRKFAGPADSEVARQIRPHTLRARFGNDKYRNAVHCTDLPEDTLLELEYFFKILDAN